MRRTSILVDPHILTELEQLARAQGRPTAHLIREAMERYVADERKPRPLPAFVGMGSGPGDVAGRDEEILERELPSAIAAEPDDATTDR
jgi:hypothetical protein